MRALVFGPRVRTLAQTDTLTYAASSPVTSITAGPSNVLIASGDEVVEFGLRSWDAGVASAATPVPALCGAGVAHLRTSAWASHVMAATRAGGSGLLAWGRAGDGQCGMGGALGPAGSYHGGTQVALLPAPTPVPALPSGRRFVTAAASRTWTWALADDGSVHVTGAGFSGELGLGRHAPPFAMSFTSMATRSATDDPASQGLPPAGVDPAVSVAAGLRFGLVTTAAGRVYMCGTLGSGGNGAEKLHCAAPTELALPEGAARGQVQLDCGPSHAIATDGERVWELGEPHTAHHGRAWRWQPSAFDVLGHSGGSSSAGGSPVWVTATLGLSALVCNGRLWVRGDVGRLFPTTHAPDTAVWSDASTLLPALCGRHVVGVALGSDVGVAVLQ